jgi:hypothetical protein
MDLKVGAHDYRTGRLDAFQQFHVSRRIAPLYAVMGNVITRLARMPDAQDEVATLDRFMDVVPAAAEMLAKMSDEDCNYVLYTCLSVCSRKEAAGVGHAAYQPLLAAERTLQYSDLTMDDMLRLAIAVCQENMSGFLKGLGGSTPSPSS